IKQVPTDTPVPFDPNVYFAELALSGTTSPGTFGAGVFKNSARTAVAFGLTNTGLSGIPGTSLNDPPGGVPLYKDGHLVGGIGVTITGFPIRGWPPRFDYPTADLGGVPGEIRFPFRDDPRSGKIGKASRLTKEEVTSIISLAAERSGHTRAGIRVPLPLPARV